MSHAEERALRRRGGKIIPELLSNRAPRPWHRRNAAIRNNIHTACFWWWTRGRPSLGTGQGGRESQIARCSFMARKKKKRANAHAPRHRDIGKWPTTGRQLDTRIKPTPPVPFETKFSGLSSTWGKLPIGPAKIGR